MFPVLGTGTCSVPTEAWVSSQNCSQGAWSPAGLEPRTHASDYGITMSFIRSGSPASPSVRQLEGVSPFSRPGSWLVLLCGAVWCWTVRCLWESSCFLYLCPCSFCFVVSFCFCFVPCSCLPVLKGSTRHPQFYLSSVHTPKVRSFRVVFSGVGGCYFLTDVN